MEESVSEAAKALGALGAAKGGRARAQRLSPGARSEIARLAAATRWAGRELPQAKYGSTDKPLRIGNIEIPCYVLDDGRRVLIQGGMMTALDMKQGTAGRGAGDRLAKFINTKSVRPFVSTKLHDMIIEPVIFRVSGGGLAYGYEATALADICDAVLAARKEGKLNYQQEHIAAQCEILVRAFARVGIIALVDEATGYQEVRARNALAEILERFVAKELRKWVKTFPADFYKELYRLRGWRYADDSSARPALVGRLTDNIVYKRLAPGVRDELRRLTPRDDKGRLKTHLHRRLTEDIGHPRLREHLAAVVALMRASSSWDGFMRSIDLALPKYGETMSLALGDGGDGA
jgi:hypothetical protein